MKKIRNICNIILAFAMVVLIGCNPMIASKVKTDKEVSKKKTTRGYDPLGLAGDGRVVPKNYPNEAEITGTALGVDKNVKVKLDSLNLKVKNLPDNFDTLNSQSYRVQLFSSKVYGDARQEMKVAGEIFDRPLFMDYEVPYYKIRVGNFIDKIAAEQYLMRVRTAGYTNAWIVMVNVNVKENAPLYNDDEIFIQLNPDSIEIPAVNDNSQEGNDE